MRLRKWLSGLLIILLLSTGCNSENSIYKGRELDIGVIGKIPDVREENIHWHNVTFDELVTKTKNIHTMYDAIFIMKEHLVQASKKQYATVFSEMRIPVFFIQSEKSYVPFIYGDMTYEETPDINKQMYATGILRTHDHSTGINHTEDITFKVWGYGLYNQIESKTNIQDVYTRIFKTIESEVQ